MKSIALQNRIWSFIFIHSIVTKDGQEKNNCQHVVSYFKVRRDIFMRFLVIDTEYIKSTWAPFNLNENGIL